MKGGYILSEEYRTKKEGEVVDYHQLLERQGAMSYYIPAKSELLRYADPYYVEKTPSYAAFCRFIQVRLGRPENEAAVIRFSYPINQCAMVQCQKTSLLRWSALD